MLAPLLLLFATVQSPRADTIAYRVMIMSYDTVKVAFLGEPDRVGAGLTTAWVRVSAPRTASGTVMIVIDSVTDASTGTSRDDYAEADVRAAWGTAMEANLDSIGRIIQPPGNGGPNPVAANLFKTVATALFPGLPKPLAVDVTWSDSALPDSTTPLVRETSTTDWKVIERTGDEWVVEGILRGTSNRSAPGGAMKAESQVVGRSRRTVTPTGRVTSFRGVFDVTATATTPQLPPIPMTHNAVTVVTRLP